MVHDQSRLLQAPHDAAGRWQSCGVAAWGPAMQWSQREESIDSQEVCQQLTA